MIPLDEGVEHPSKIGTQHEDCIRKQRSEAQTELGTDFSLLVLDGGDRGC